ncbi:Phospholipid/glycerol acyltransferase [Kalmanozyma brasiliensis GHG001]|uniref:Phospholipid/glycerol acyltransferase n=1 Tax=Kalmanozyma brasiliensis (strain GHG001) TaxID=1365824 RepID=UPI002867C1FF|nr:Phospholipid/glycerol acyltransferase [Kalmanozyma brasiliensis GHG001]KAF6767404.1 Phospholipid/glycerol acyltransferase [Kalmanozyma brasiliensis GHG001]
MGSQSRRGADQQSASTSAAGSSSSAPTDDRSDSTGSRSGPPSEGRLPSVQHESNVLSKQLGDLGSSRRQDRNLADQKGILTSEEHKLGDLNVVAAYKAHFRESPFEFLQQFVAYGQGTGWRGYSNYIGAPILYKGCAEESIRAVLNSDQVQERIRALASSRVDHLLPEQPPLSPTGPNKTQKNLAVFKERKKRQIEQQLRDEALAILQVSVARVDSLPFVKFFAATVNNILARMYHQGIHISVPQVLELRRVAAYAAERKQSILFLPCHKSHIDYLTVSWLMFRLGIGLPHIIAGENLDLPVLGDVLRKGGAFFIRRTFSGDQLYPAVIKEYVETLLASGKNLECFIEGTRSRTGKLLPPKLGILKYVVEGLLNGRTDDVWICPVSLQYDSVIESGTYVSELLGKPKEAESLLGLLSDSSSLLQLKMGRIDIRFDTPWSLQGFIKEQKDRRAAPGLKGEKVELDPVNNEVHKVLLLKALGYRVLADINKVSVVMPAALIGTVVLTLRGRGVSRSELIRRVDWLRSAIIKKGFTVADFGTMKTGEVVDRALNTVMKGLITEQKDVMEPTFVPDKHFELSFYRNQVIHIFVSESLAAAALYTKVKQGGTAPMQRMTRKELLNECMFISSVLRNEFVFGVDTLETNVDRTIDGMVADGVLDKHADIKPEDGGSIELSAKERENGRENYDSFLFLIWPFIEGYWLAAVSLFSLIPKGAEAHGYPTDKLPWFAAKDFEKHTQLLGKTLYAQGELSYLESINAATLSQAFTRMEEMSMILRKKSSHQKPIPIMALNPNFWPSQTSNLAAYIDRLSQFRREGKDRREKSVGAKVRQYTTMYTPSVVEESTIKQREAQL